MEPQCLYETKTEEPNKARQPMKPTAIFLAIAFAACPLLANDESDLVMPDIVKKAQTTVEVFMRHSPPTGECFPDPSARVRIIDGVVMLTDLALYPHMIANISEGLVAFQKGREWGACDKNGKVIIAPQFESRFSFSSGIAGVRRGGKYGFSDKEARLIIEPKFDVDYTWDFVGDVCPVRVAGKNAVIDRKGSYVWELGLLRAENLGGGIYIQTADGRSGFLNDKGSLIPKGEPNRNYYKAK